VAHDSKEANRNRQQRHRDRQRAVTGALNSVRAARALQVVENCIKCNPQRLCSAHQKLVAGAAGRMAKGGHFARRDLVTGGYDRNKLVVLEKLRRANNFPADDPYALLAEALVMADDPRKEWFESKVREAMEQLMDRSPELTCESFVIVARARARELYRAELEKEVPAWRSNRQRNA
jgi:hypothetical protein